MRQWLIIGVIDLHESPPTQQVREAICTVMDQLSKNSRHVAVVSGAISDCESVFVQEAKRRSCPTLMVLPMHFESLCQHVSSDKASWIQAVVRESIYIDMAESSPNLADGLREADVLTVDRADAILAIVDVKQLTCPTSQDNEILAYCRACRKTLVLIDSTSGQITFEKQASVAEPVSLSDSKRLSQWYSTPSPCPLPRSGGEGSGVSSNQPPLTGSDTELDPRLQLEHWYQVHEAQANRLAPWARALMLRMIIINLAVAGITATVLSLDFSTELKTAANFLKMAALAVVLLLARRQKRTQQQWADARLAAELCRVYLDGLWPLKRHRMLECRLAIPGWNEMLKSLQMCWYMGRNDAKELQIAKQQYLTGRIDHQREYYSEHSLHAGRWHPRLKIFATSATVVAMGATGAFIFTTDVVGLDNLSTRLLRLVSAVLPIISAAVLSWIVARDLPRRSHRYAEMKAILEQQAASIRAAPNWPSLWRAVVTTENLLLQELTEWYTKNRGTDKSAK
jgi:hypothetical protein